MAIVLVITATVAAMLLIVAYSDRLFEENRTRVVRPRSVRRPAADEVTEFEGLVWRTLVGANAAGRAPRPRTNRPAAVRHISNAELDDLLEHAA